VLLNSYAKLNLSLVVLGKRKDGYHEIKTVLERIDLCDKITLIPRPDAQIRIFCKYPGVPTDNSNLAYKSAEFLQKKFNLKKGVDIGIKKLIPPGAGLGGGSSNAAAVLLGLNKMWRLNKSRPFLAKIGARIGSDVPFFIYDHSFALARGRGEKIRQIGPFKKIKFWHVIVYPGINTPTKLIYSYYDKLPSFRLTAPHSYVILNTPLEPLLRKISAAKPGLNAVKRGLSAFSRDFLKNDLEKAAFALYPQLARIKKKMISFGCEYVSMSGSGSSIFALVTSKNDAHSLAKNLKAVNKSWEVFTASTI
jgi:4-diphosphocytidyl-2-C-methyl-D-erythritol kinase